MLGYVALSMGIGKEENPSESMKSPLKSPSTSTESAEEVAEREDTRLWHANDRKYLSLQDISIGFNELLLRVSKSDVSLTTNMAWLYKQGYFPQLDIRSDVYFRLRRMASRPARDSTYVMYLVVDDKIILEGRGIGKEKAFRDLYLEVSQMVTEAVDRIGESETAWEEENRLE
ncbi:uncharacterized protein J4E84_004510 [Alternaria hordeiaustralica]|uniref:uncharacterized protein n=1 Tax=Alternaria hordeiaustralica TaxID=1187925 RepID=UPI0020C52749|nr:uncharacterized protein J4E84_004510 [Alternaria hordeiaustralica]KAI4688580.1 hypothetical protein J4E84_004510 [Alternaria hordeiaustralica]